VFDHGGYAEESKIKTGLREQMQCQDGLAVSWKESRLLLIEAHNLGDFRISPFVATSKKNNYSAGGASIEAARTSREPPQNRASLRKRDEGEGP
jgi:hypothetical protein